MMPHQREEYRQQMGHLWLGFSREEVEGLLDQPAFGAPVPAAPHPDPEAKGPALFVASAVRKS
jgi:ArsR family transcriptional regulator